MRSICPVFNTNRMLKEYTDRFYINAHLDYASLAADGYAAAKSRAGWLNGLHRHWKDVSIQSAEDTINGELKIGDEFEITARVRAGSLKPEDLRVEALWGYVDSRGGFDAPRANVMLAAGKAGDQIVYKIKVRADRIGHCGYVLRVMPNSDRPHIRYAPGLIMWK